MSATKEHHHDAIEAGQRGQKQHPIGWLNMPGYKPETWNPIIGCDKISPACEHCFAEIMANRLSGMPKTSYYKKVITNGKWNGKTVFAESQIMKPLNWKTPRMIFTVDMGDLFHETVKYSWIDRVFEVMNKCPQHIFILLTKRPENAVKYLVDRLGSLSNISKKEDGNTWWGVTVENQEQANKRIPILLQIPAAKLFVSIEPMLGPIELTDIKYFNAFYGDIKLNSLKGYTMYESINSGMPCFTECEKLDWVICGGETGHKARPMHPDWVRSLRDQCKAADTPFFFKQWGEFLPSCQTPNKVFFGMHKREVQFQSPHNPSKMNTYLKLGSKDSGNWMDDDKHHEWPQINL